MAEMQMDKLAEQLGMDPVEIRLKNALKDGDTMGVGTPSPSPVSVMQCIEAAAEKFDWLNSNTKTGSAAHLKRGKGIAARFKNIGFYFGYQENCWAKIEIHGNTEIGHVVLHHAGAEVGQGTHTVMAQMAAEAVGIPFEKVKIVASDSATMGNSGSVSASRMTFMAGNSIKGAAEVALKKWVAEERPAIGEFKYLAPRTVPGTVFLGRWYGGSSRPMDRTLFDDQPGDGAGARGAEPGPVG